MKSPNKNIYYYVMAHISLAETMLKKRSQMLITLANSEHDSFITMSYNFEQMTQQLCHYLKKIEQYAQAYQGQKNEELSSIIRSWQSDTKNIENHIQSINQNILKQLHIQASQAKQELSKNYQNRKKLNGYNLSSVKR